MPPIQIIERKTRTRDVALVTPRATAAPRTLDRPIGAPAKRRLPMVQRQPQPPNRQYPWNATKPRGPLSLTETLQRLVVEARKQS
jgi:hypothetical protein